ncbi:MAG: hypothetical protein RLY31_1009 [Bacteroidota bacterium]|jgi:hydroxymethylglutaryl-CoA lyase
MATTAPQTLILTECPRDAMQGWHAFIPTATKAAYLNLLLSAGFDILDFGSFVSPKAIPQLRDTAEVLEQLDLARTRTRLLAIVANEKGASMACGFEQIRLLGFPFSVSETFQLRNTNATIEASLERVASIQECCARSGKELVVYLSMGFGNPYGDPWNAEVVMHWAHRLAALDVRTLQLSDTIGVSNPANIRYLFSVLMPFGAEHGIDIGAHLHTDPWRWEEKLRAAWESGCRRFDGAVSGYGGCPMAKDELTGNMPTEKMVAFFEGNGIKTGIDLAVLEACRIFAGKMFTQG